MHSAITTTPPPLMNQSWYRLGVRIAIGIALLSIVVYVNFIISTTIHISEQRNSEDTARTLSSEIAELEMQYFQASNMIDLDTAAAYGFHDAEETHFVYRDDIQESGVSVAQR